MGWVNMVGYKVDRGWTTTALAVLLGLGACASDDEPGGGDSEADSDGDPTATEGMSSSASTTVPTTTTDTTTGDASTGNDDGGFINSGDDTGGDMPPGPLGGMCSANGECMSGFCYQVPQLGGVCSECLVDMDCGTGTCSIDVGSGYAVCTDGSIGNMCNSDEGCMGDLVCTELIDTGGLFNGSFCSECGPTAPCTDTDICAPVYDTSAFSGHFECVPPGSVESGGGCPVDDGVGNGDACVDGFCEVVDVFMGFVSLGICGECLMDADCPVQGQTCMPGSAGQDGLLGATCVDP